MISDLGGVWELTGPSNEDGTYVNSERSQRFVFSKYTKDYSISALLKLIEERYTDELPEWIDYLRFTFHVDDSKMTKTMQFVDLWIDPRKKTVSQVLASRHNLERMHWVFSDLDELIEKLPYQLLFERDRKKNS